MGLPVPLGVGVRLPVSVWGIEADWEALILALPVETVRDPLLTDSVAVQVRVEGDWLLVKEDVAVAEAVGDLLGLRVPVGECVAEHVKVGTFDTVFEGVRDVGVKEGEAVLVKTAEALAVRVVVSTSVRVGDPVGLLEVVPVAELVGWDVGV